jgi:hypothetical protein
VILQSIDDRLRWYQQRLAEPYESTVFWPAYAYDSYRKPCNAAWLSCVNPDDLPALFNGE